ncbi:hypothetical protein EYF80_064025 [Liparis tanakae]|uniref:Uncharacterized protein n=1 Tax=Liparis tanakae TaxID=230148 RepID=A0A4Z2EAU2_9TELE|nr:hypothetical protein EYF80_064025 [Liparis tanakae]
MQSVNTALGSVMGGAPAPRSFFSLLHSFTPSLLHSFTRLLVFLQTRRQEWVRRQRANRVSVPHFEDEKLEDKQAAPPLKAGRLTVTYGPVVVWSKGGVASAMTLR